MKIKVFVTFFWSLSLLFIIYNAMQTGSQSSGFSLNIAMYVQNILKNMLIYESIDTLHVIIRVCGHITQDMIFGYLSFWMILIYQVSWYNIFGIIVVMCIDEGLQSVTPGRYAEFNDILMDVFVVIIAFVLYLLSKRLFKNYGG